MTAKELYLHALDRATEMVERVRPEHLTLPTPDTEWNVHELLQHIIYELAWTADIASGKTIAEVGDKYDGNLLHDSPSTAWRHYAALTRAAVEAADESATAHLSYSDTTVGNYLWEAGNDQLVHAWDLGQGMGIDVMFGDVVAKALYDWAYDRKDAFENSGLFAAAVSVPPDANFQLKLLALEGRSEDWAEQR